jgi:magnesium transporter
MNVVMKKFNAMATIVLPMTVVTGMWGMNVPVPGQSGVTEPPNLSWFFGITAGLVFFAIVAVILFKKIKWL